MGNSILSTSFAVDVPVHPHACGELKWDNYPRNGSLGSSPRLWGTLFLYIIQNPLQRFIPTPVGNSSQGNASQ
ncbi:CRISPR associated protein of unknown function [Methanosarcina barkeri 227]|uniref:Uncharacterized protein n=1 Tax=Methanosarcina barkeri 227 TaxID=1434106 RepID=A0A0E3R1S6_METBA|nr:CRISPR associated protein of unknown function [Methanosarcina barkeri 227]